MGEVADDDASPTGGMGMDAFDFGEEEEEREKKALGGAGSDTGLMGDREMREREKRMQAGSRGGRRPNTFEIEKAERQPQGFGNSGFDDDDASPTGGTGAMDPSYDGTSAWERIRQGSSSGGSGSIPRRRGGVVQEQQGGDSFSFSSSDEEKSYAQSESQKAFDERVEKERRGGDFSDEAKRW
ncbi:MAG: hypothetical protein Q9164_005882 [Protoblastenia rupestris]